MIRGQLGRCVGCGETDTPSPPTHKLLHKVNVFGMAAVTRAFLPLLRASSAAPGRTAAESTGSRLHSPRIIMMSSLVGRIAIPWASVYSASKHAVEALCDALRLELRQQGIKVVAIEPGIVKTNLTASMWKAAQQTLESSRAGPRAVYQAEFLKVGRAV